MQRLNYSPSTFAKALAEFAPASNTDTALQSAVATILADVARDGDTAITRYAEKFDGVALPVSAFRVPPAEIKAAAARLPRAQKSAIREARDSVRAFHRQTMPRPWTGKNPHGAMVGERFYPIRRVGINVPRGQVPLPSTAIMTTCLAKIAGVPEIAVFTPVGRDGKVADVLLGTFHLCGVTEVYAVGGVYGVGAMAFGTETIRRVDKIFGPSNAYVCEAMRQVFGTVGVAGLPGPSEVMVIADETANPRYAAADLLAQAEHGSGKEKIYLAATKARMITAIEKEIKRQAATLSHGAALAKILAEGFLAIKVPDLKAAAVVANAIAPEHLELLIRTTAFSAMLQEITTAGAIMLGNETPTALGDYIAGPSHVLPTGRAGRFFSGLRVDDFMRRSSVIRYTAKGVAQAAPAVTTLAGMEQLDAHARSVQIRLEKPRS